MPLPCRVVTGSKTTGTTQKGVVPVVCIQSYNLYYTNSFPYSAAHHTSFLYAPSPALAATSWYILTRW